MSKEVKILGGIVVVVVILALIGSSLYRTETEAVKTNNGSSNNSAANNEALIRDDSYKLGNADAKVKVVEFLDPECEACAAFHPIMKKVLKQYDGKVHYVVRYMPLHPNSLTAATFLEAAGEQGKYWEAMDILFLKQPEWGTKHGPQPANAPKVSISELFKGYADELKLDKNKMDAVFADNKFVAKIERDKKDGQTLGATRTPTIFVNGGKLASLSEPALTYKIESELKK